MPHPQRGGCGTTFRSGLPRLHSSIYLISLWLATLKPPGRYERGRKAGDVSDPPKNRGVMRSRTDGIWDMPLYRPPWGRSRPHLSLREGSEQPPSAALKAPLLQSLLQPPPFPLALDDPGSVLAVKGSLRRFAPWTAPGRSEGMTVYEGKGGMQISQ